MPDITMFLNKECPKKETCYRFKAVAGDNQSYTVYTFLKVRGIVVCDRFVKV